MSLYQFTSGSNVLRSDGANIPPDIKNADWQAYLAWRAAGNTPDPSPAPTVQQQADAAIAAGLAIASTGTPAINGTYALDDGQQTNLANVSIYIAVNNRFPAGQSSLMLRLADGKLISIPSTAAWQAIATAIADYIAHLKIQLVVAARGGTPSWPSASVTIP